MWVILKNLLENVCNGVCLQYCSRLQAVHMDQNFRATILWNISKQLFQLFSQINFRMLLHEIFTLHFSIDVYLSLYLCVKCTALFKSSNTSWSESLLLTRTLKLKYINKSYDRIIISD